MKRIIHLLRLSSQPKKTLLLALLLQAVTIIVSIAPAVVLKMAADAIQAYDLQLLWNAIYLALISTVIYLVAEYFYQTSFAKGVNASQKTTQSFILRMVLSMKKAKFKDENQGTLMTKVMQNSVDSVDQSIHWLFDLFIGAFSILIVMIYMYTLSWEMALFLVLYNLIIRYITRYFAQKIKAARTKLIKTTNEANNILMDILKNAAILRIFAKQMITGSLFHEQEDKVYKHGFRIFALQNGTNEFIWCTQKIAELAILYGLGAWLIVRGSMGIGALAAFTLLSDLFTKAITAITNSTVSYHQALANLDAVDDLLGGAHSEEGATAYQSGSNGAIRFDRVCFSYQDRTILDDVSFTLNPKDKVLVVGGNGQGKSTLLGLLTGLIRPSGGSIYLGDAAMDDKHIDAISSAVTYIPQDASVIDDDSYRNIALSGDYDRAEADAILTSLGLDAVKDHDPLTYSQGEQQRLCIGRGMYKAKHTPIVLCDEILSNVDYKNREAIASTLKEHFLEKTVLMVAHDESFFAYNKKIIVDQGKVHIECMEAEA